MQPLFISNISSPDSNLVQHTIFRREFQITGGVRSAYTNMREQYTFELAIVHTRTLIIMLLLKRGYAGFEPLLHQRIVNPNLAKFVFNHRDL